MMNDPHFSAVRDAVKARAHGQWRALLERLGVDAKLLDKRGHPCPSCGGKDRFSFTDKFGDGDYFCRGCGPGDGFKLLELTLQLSFTDALKRVGAEIGVEVERRQGADQRRPANAEARKGRESQHVVIWRQAKPVQAGDDVDRYLSSRGLHMEQYPEALRCHPRLSYNEEVDGKKQTLGHYAGMVARLIGADGQAITVHRTYLEDGRKAPVKEVKKVVSSCGGGPAIRLAEATEELCITEGIETGLAVLLRTRKPVWAAYSATNLAGLWIPDSVRLVNIYADNDANFAGQAAAYALAKRLRTVARSTELPEVHVYVPAKTGEDWNDVYCRRMRIAA